MFDVCFFTASMISLLICCSRLMFSVEVFPTAIAVASVASIVAVFLNLAVSIAAAFLILFSFSILE